MSTAGTVYEALVARGRMGGVLQRVDANTLSYLPYLSNQIKINGIWRTIPSSGIAGLTRTGCFVNGAAGQNLANSTRYFIYAFMNGSVITADFSATTHATSLTAGNVGNEIKSADDSRTLIGMAYVVSSAFADAPETRLVRSWANRNAQRRDLAGYYGGQASFATDWQQFAPQITFLKWENESVRASMAFGLYHDPPGYNNYMSLVWTGVMVRTYVAFQNAHGMYNNASFTETVSGADAGPIEQLNTVSGYGASTASVLVTQGGYNISGEIFG